jgi:hypothetical protein
MKFRDLSLIGMLGLLVVTLQLLARANKPPEMPRDFPHSVVSRNVREQCLRCHQRIEQQASGAVAMSAAAMIDAPILLVEPKAERVSYATQLANAKAVAAADAHANGMTLSDDPTQAMKRTLFTLFCLALLSISALAQATSNTETKKADPAAWNLLKSARETSQNFPANFAGVTVEVVLNDNGKITKGTLTYYYNEKCTVDCRVCGRLGAPKWWE